ncbi:MAG: NUDIX domain-containing protein [Candidatus Paceibacterota bacterium]
MKIGVLVLYLRKGKILLCKKWTGAKIGANKWNSYGGELEVGEDSADAGVRETHEESNWGLNVKKRHLVPKGEITFYDWQNTALWFVYLFTCTEFEGEPLESEEMKTPTWFSPAEIPTLDMLPADKIFIPMLIAGDEIRDGWVRFSKDMTAVEDYHLPTTLIAV